MIKLGWPGLEPGTNALKGRCSTIELPTHMFHFSRLGSLATNPESLRGCSTIELPTRAKLEFVNQTVEGRKRVIHMQRLCLPTRILSENAATTCLDPSVKVPASQAPAPPQIPKREQIAQRNFLSIES